MPDYVIKRRISSDEELSFLREKTRSFENYKYSKEEKELFDNAIKEILEQADNNNSKITLRYLCQKIGISTRSISDIIANNPYYSELWEKVKKREKVNKKSQDDIKEEENRIRAVLQHAIKNNKKLTHAQISELAQINRGSINFRIQSNPELIELYEQVKNPQKNKIKASDKELKELMRQILNNYLSQNKKIGIAELEQLTGVSDTLIYRLLNTDEKLQALWKKVQKREFRRYSAKNIKDLDDYMHRFFLQKREKNEKTTLNEIAQYFDVPTSLVVQRINANPQLKYQWSKVKSGNTTKYDKDEAQDQTQRIIKILKDVDELNEKITVEELSSMIGLARYTIVKRIKNSSKANTLWQKVKSKNHTIYSKKEIKKQISDIQRILLKAIIENKKISKAQIAQMLNVNQSTVALRLNRE